MQSKKFLTTRCGSFFFHGFDAVFRSATLAIDGSIVAALALRGFIVTDVEPGDRAISAWVRYVPLGEYVMTTRIKAGELYYIKASQRFERMAYPLLGAIGTAFFFSRQKRRI